MFKSLRAKILFRVLVLLLAAIISIGVVSSILSYTSTEDSMKQTLTVISEQVDLRIKNRIAQSKAILTQLGLNNAFTNPEITTERKMEIIKDRAAQFNALDYGFIDENGFDDTGEDYNNNEFYKRALAGETFFSEPTKSKNGDLLVYCFAPIREDGMTNGNVVGAVFLAVDCNYLSNLMSGISVGKTGIAYIIDKNGTYIGHPDHEGYVKAQVNYQTKPDADHEEVARMQRNAMTHFQTQDSVLFQKYYTDGAKKYGVFNMLEDSDDWMIIISTHENEWLDTTYTAIIVTVIIAVVMVLAGVVVAFSTANMVVKPIKKTLVVMNEVSSGNLGVNIDYKSADEVGQLATAINSTIASINRYVAEISRICEEISNGNFDFRRQIEFSGDFIKIIETLNKLAFDLTDTMQSIDIAASQVSQGATQISDGATSLASGTTEQASSIEELASIVVTLNDKVANNAKNAVDANNKAAAAGEKIDQSNAHMQDMIKAMNNISEKSHEISNIIKTIEDISFQTNILALNAAIEAARAGASGKGFAVVADEVRNLASKSAEAAQSTTELIQQSIEAVENGSEIANETAEALNASVEVTSQAVALINDISTASKEQATMIEQVNVGIDQISSVVQTNAATAEQSAASSEELNSQAVELQNLTSKFILRTQAR